MDPVQTPSTEGYQAQRVLVVLQATYRVIRMEDNSATTAELRRIASQLEDLKRLAIMQLLLAGGQSSHIATALGIDASAISRMMPVREIKKLAPKQPQDAN